MRLKILSIITIIFSIFLQGCSSNSNFETLKLLEQNSGEGFEYPYFLFIPDNSSKTEKLTIIVEPNNTGFCSDDLNEHIKSAKIVASNEFYLGNYLAQKLESPLLVPVFPRAKSTWKIYTHALD